MARPRALAFESCLSHLAVLAAGRGLGVEPFKPNRGPLKLSENMIIENLAKVLDIATETVDSIADVSEDPAGADSPNEWRAWSAEEAQAAIGAQQYLHGAAACHCLARRLYVLHRESADAPGLLERAQQAEMQAHMHGSDDRIMTMQNFCYDFSGRALYHCHVLELTVGS